MISDQRYNVESEERWRKWVDEIPTINFPSEWNVKIIPPFAGAMARFQVILDNASVSVYLDVYDNLGFFGEPYWEIYPYNDDTYRCKMNDVKELLNSIEESLNNQLK